MAESTRTIECDCKPKYGDGCIHNWNPPRWGFRLIPETGSLEKELKVLAEEQKITLTP